jgi:PAS domain S-box-containing protein
LIGAILPNIHQMTASGGERARDSHWRYSLGWRLPALISAVLVGVLVVVLYAAYREVETTLSEAGAERARHAAGQVATLFSRSTQQSLEQLQQVAGVVAAYLREPSDDRLAEAQTAAARLGPTPLRRVSVWNAAGARLFELPAAEPSAGTADRPPVPPRTSPASAGLSPLGAAGDRVFTDATVEIRDPRAATAAPLGSITVRTAITVTPPDALNRLIGADARILFGNRSGDVWTDTVRRADGPGVNIATDGVAEYRASDGAGRIGALSGLPGTPWVVWVEFPRAGIVSRAGMFLRRLALFALLAAGATVILVRWFTVRVTAPLSQMTIAAEAVAGGDFSRRVIADRSDEIGRLGRAFNAMTTQVADAQRELTQRVDERTNELNAALAALHQRSRERETYLATIVDSSADAIVANDLHGTITSWNKAAETIFGYTADEMVGASVMRLVPAEKHDEERQVLGQIGRGEQVKSLETRRLTKQRKVLQISLTVSPILDATGAIIGASKVMRDITEQRTLEQQFQQAQKLEAIGRLAGGVAHDFNNLLTAISGFGRFVLDSFDPDDERRADVDQILQAADRASALTRQLLAFSRKEVVQPVVVHLNDAVVGTHKMLQRLIGEHIEVDLALADDAGAVHADPGQINQIIMNLAVNARDAMPNGGCLTIETANVDLDASFASTHGPVEPGPYVMLAVTDTGVGMGEDTRRRLFEPFFTTKERGQGTGLGLATVFGIVKQSAGYLYVYSEPGQGSTFKIYLPRLAAGAVAAAPISSSPVQRGTETVLLVEDEQAVRQLVLAILKSAGYHVLNAANPREAEQLIGDRSSDIDILVTDVIMPGGTGPALFAQLQAANPRLRVLYISGYTGDATFRTGRLEAGVAFLQKPFAADALLRKLREVLEAQPQAQH